MLQSKYYRVLFFIDGPMPTPEQRTQAMFFGPHCMFRNVQHHNPDTAREDCDAVTGYVPDSYADLPAAIPISEWYALHAQKPAVPEVLVPFMPSPPDPFAVPPGTQAPLDPFRPPTAPPAWQKNP